ncbi:MAG TPA: AAA family ATPase [Geminicoccaceae bacterium]|nr:AAA family ATPase [Geminicoccaceae bacterium]
MSAGRGGTGDGIGWTMGEKGEQATVFAFLGRGDAYGAPGLEVERIDTHAAAVFLAGERAYKVKRAVRFSFLDFTALARRRAALEAELRLNRRTAPGLYRRVLPVTRGGDGALALDGAGEPVEWLLEMARFDQDALLDRIAARDELDDALIDRLAATVAGFHARAERRPDRGGYAGMVTVVDGNAEDFAGVPEGVLPADGVAALNREARAALEARRALLEARREAGRVRLCHGDLHLGNIVLLDGKPVLFDCIEFNESFACIDVLYDLAFLLMDLCHRGLRAKARRLLDGYLDETRDDAGLALLPLFLSCRAAIRAKVHGLAVAVQRDAAERDGHARFARDYLREALEFLRPPPPRLVAIGGMSGTGKSSLAYRLAPELGAAPGAVVLRSDLLRKRLMGAAPTERLGPEGYGREMTEAVYRRIEELAETLLRAGHTVIADAVYGDTAHRVRIWSVTVRTGAPFTGLWLEAPLEILQARVGARRGDASDATAAVVRSQWRGLRAAKIRWHRLDASGDPETTAERAHAIIEAPGGS